MGLPYRRFNDEEERRDIESERTILQSLLFDHMIRGRCSASMLGTSSQNPFEHLQIQIASSSVARGAGADRKTGRHFFLEDRYVVAFLFARFDNYITT